jgi:hypothetical protein
MFTSIADSLMLQAMHMFMPLADSRLCLLPSLGRQNPVCECGNSPHEGEVRIEALQLRDQELATARNAWRNS